MARGDTGNTTNPMMWLALGISIVALALAVVSLNRTGGVRSTADVAELQTQLESLEQQAEVARAREKLEDIRERVARGGADLDQVQKEIAEIRSDLKKSFQNAKGNALASWQKLDNELDVLETQLRKGGVNILDAIDRAIQNLKAEIQED